MTWFCSWFIYSFPLKPPSRSQNTKQLEGQTRSRRITQEPSSSSSANPNCNYFTNKVAQQHAHPTIYHNDASVGTSHHSQTSEHIRIVLESLMMFQNILSPSAESVCLCTRLSPQRSDIRPCLREVECTGEKRYQSTSGTAE